MLSHSNEKFCARAPSDFKHHGARIEPTAAMKDETNFATTIRQSRAVDGRAHFAPRSNVTELLLRAAIPFLWFLMFGVAVLALWFF